MSKKNLKANHNGTPGQDVLVGTVLNLVKEKFESKSQLPPSGYPQPVTVLNLVKEKFESKSQPFTRQELAVNTVLNLVKEKFESKSQLKDRRIARSINCFKSCQRKI